MLTALALPFVLLATAVRAPLLQEGPPPAIGVTAVVRTQADGRVRVEFNTTGTASDPGLVERISASYERRMGR